MGGYRGRGNTRDYEWPRMACPECGRDTAYSINPHDSAQVRLRRHNRPRYGLPCPMGGASHRRWR